MRKQNPFGDVVLPPKGGWIIVKRRPPLNLPQVPIFSIFYAKPGNVFLEGSFTDWPPGMRWAGHSDKEAPAIYRHRYTRTPLFGGELDAAKSGDDDGLALEMQVEIQAPDGTVTLNPYEWTPCGDVQPFIDEIGDGVTAAQSAKISEVKRQIFIETQCWAARASGCPAAGFSTMSRSRPSGVRSSSAKRSTRSRSMLLSATSDCAS